MAEPTIERSPGIVVGMCHVAGGGGAGLTPELDAVVAEAAAKLAAAFDHDVTIRFNSDRRSGGAWLRTSKVDGIWLNAEVGVRASLRHTREEAERLFGQRAREYEALGDGFWRDLIERSDGSIVIDACVAASWLRDPSVANGGFSIREGFAGTFGSVDEAVGFVAANARPPAGKEGQ